MGWLQAKAGLEGIPHGRQPVQQSMPEPRRASPPRASPPRTSPKPRPRSSSPAKPTAVTLQIQVPQGAAPGSTLQVQAPDGRRLERPTGGV